MATIKQVKVGSTTYDIEDTTKLPLTGGTVSGDLIITAPHRDTYYASNLCRHFYSGTPTEFVVKTKIKYVSGTHMPVIRIYGYAYGLNCPIELRVGFYIYSGNLGWSGVACTGAWKPEVYLFKYTENSVDYVALGLKGSCYFCGFQVDCQIGASGSFGTSLSIDGWTTTHNGADTTQTLIPAVGTNNCIKVDYKPMQTDIGGNAATATNASKLENHAASYFAVNGSATSSNGAHTHNVSVTGHSHGTAVTALTGVKVTATGKANTDAYKASVNGTCLELLAASTSDFATAVGANGTGSCAGVVSSATLTGSAASNGAHTHTQN